MDHVEVRALVQLGERDIWKVDELPPGIDVDLLRCLDGANLIQARFCYWENRQQLPQDLTPPAQASSAWFSPMQKPGMAGGWDSILSSHISDHRKLPHEIMLTEQGRAELSRLHRRQIGINSGANEEKIATDWRDMQRRLLRLCERGDAYTSIGDLAERMSCAKATIQKAMKDSTTLEKWQALHSREKKSLRASSLNEIVMDNAEQTREPNPADQAEANDVDVIFARLIEEAQPEERAQLNSMNADKRREFVALLGNDSDKYNRVLGRKP